MDKASTLKTMTCNFVLVTDGFGKVPYTILLKMIGSIIPGMVFRHFTTIASENDHSLTTWLRAFMHISVHCTIFKEILAGRADGICPGNLLSYPKNNQHLP